MKQVRSFLAAAGLAGLISGVVAAPAVMAHHSFAFFDLTKSTTIEGTVTKYEWSNPHSWLFVSAPGPRGGAPVTYGFELSSVGEMLRSGWKKTSLKPGDKVKVQFRPTRDGKPNGLLQSAWDRNGKLIGKGRVR